MDNLSPAAIGWTIAAAAFLVPVIAVHKGRFTPFGLTLALMVPLVTGHAILDTTNSSDELVGLYVTGLAALVVGYCVVPRRAATVNAHTKSLDISNSLLVLLLVVGGLSIYHFAVGGVPVLSSSVELDRFDFTSSGLLGLPGRAYLYGLPIVTVLATFNALSSSNPRAKWILAMSIALLLLSRVASGFKGALVEFVVIVFFASAAATRGLSLARVATRYVALGALAIGFAALIAPTYFSYSGLTGNELANRLVERATSAGALPGQIVMEQSPPLVVLPSKIAVLDAQYIAFKYVGLDLGEHFSFDQIVTASIYGSPLSSTGVPETVGAFAQLVYDLGRTLAVVAMVGIGIIFRRLEEVAGRTSNPIVYVTAVSALLALNDYLTKGDLVYLAVNWSVMLVFVLIVIRATNVLTHSPTGVNLESKYHGQAASSPA